MKNIQPGKGFSEVFVESDDAIGAYRLIVDPYSYFLFTTYGPEVAYLEAIIAQGFTTDQAVEYMCKHKPPMTTKAGDRPPQIDEIIVDDDIVIEN